MLAFIDESGYPRPTDSTRNPVLVAVCVHETDIRAITNQIYKLKESLYGKQDEIKSTKLLREATITKNRSINRSYTEQMVGLLNEFDSAVFAVIMERPETEIITPEHHLPRQYYLLQKKVEFYCAAHKFDKALMIFDEIHEEADRKIADAMTGFYFKTSLGRSFDHILEMPLFVSSAVTPSIQLADIYAGVIRHYYEMCLDEHDPVSDYQVWIRSLFDILRSRTEDNPVPGRDYLEYGFQNVKSLTYRVSENSVLTKSE